MGVNTNISNESVLGGSNLEGFGSGVFKDVNPQNGQGGVLYQLAEDAVKKITSAREQPQQHQQPQQPAKKRDILDEAKAGVYKTQKEFEEQPGVLEAIDRFLLGKGSIRDEKIWGVFDSLPSEGELNPNIEDEYEGGPGDIPGEFGEDQTKPEVNEPQVEPRPTQQAPNVPESKPQKSKANKPAKEAPSEPTSEDMAKNIQRAKSNLRKYLVNDRADKIQEYEDKIRGLARQRNALGFDQASLLETSGSDNTNIANTHEFTSLLKRFNEITKELDEIKATASQLDEQSLKKAAKRYADLFEEGQSILARLQRFKPMVENAEKTSDGDVSLAKRFKELVEEIGSESALQVPTKDSEELGPTETEFDEIQRRLARRGVPVTSLVNAVSPEGATSEEVPNTDASGVEPASSEEVTSKGQESSTGEEVDPNKPNKKDPEVEAVEKVLKGDRYRTDREMRIEHEKRLYKKFDKFWDPEVGRYAQIFEGMIEVKGKNEDDTYYLMTDDLSNAFTKFCNLFGVPIEDENREYFFAITLKFLGVNPDRHDRLFGEDQDGKKKPKIPDGIINLAVNKMEQNWRDYGYPFVYTPGLKLYDTPCFPVPIFSKRELKFMMKGDNDFNKLSRSEILERGLLEWRKPNGIFSAIEMTQDPALKMSYETYVRYLIDRTEDAHKGAHTPDKWYVPDIEDAFASEKIQEINLQNVPGLNQDVKKSAAIVDEMIHRAIVLRSAFRRQKLFLRRNRLDEEIRKNGRTEEDVRISETQLAATVFIEGMAKFCAALSLVFDVPLAASSAAEAVVGNVEYRGILALRHQFYSNLEKERFVMSKALREMCHGAEAYEALSAFKAVEKSFGRAAAYWYLSENNILTADTATAWVQQHFGMETDRKKQVKGNMSEGKWIARMNRFYDTMQLVQTGDWIARRYDVELLVDSCLMNYCLKVRKEGDNVAFLTAADLETSFRLSQMKTVRDILLQDEGRKGYAWSQMRTLGGNSLVAARYERHMLEHRIQGSAVRLFISNFPIFMINSTSRLNPFLHTSQLLSLKMRTNINKNREGSSKNELHQQDFYEMLSSDSFIQALQLDLLRAPGCVARIAVCCAVFALIPGGFDEPEDEDKKGMWDEWVFGVMYDEDGNRIIGSGFRARMCWYMFDIMGWAGPASVALYAFSTGKASLSEACAILTDGMSDIVFDLAPGEFVNMLHDFDTTWQAAQAIALEDGFADPGVMPPETAIDYIGSFGSIAALDWLTKKFTPRVAREFLTSGWGPDFFAPDPTKVFTTDPNDGDDTEYVTDYTERQLRIRASRNPLLGVLLNVFSGYYWNDETEYQMTGYAPWDQPDQTRSDPVNVSWYSHFAGVSGEYENGEFVGTAESIAGIEEWFGIVDKVALNTPPEQLGEFLAQNGVCLPPQAQYAIRGYCWAQMNDARARYKAGVITKDQYNAEVAYYQIQDDLISSGAIPSKAAKYKQWNTNLQATYTDSEGNQHSELAYQVRNAPLIGDLLDIMGVDDIEVSFSPYGDYNNSYQIIAAMAHSVEQTYDAQTGVVWQGDFTDPEFIKTTCENLNLAVEYGQNAGKNVYDVITGDGQAFQADGSIRFVIGSRAYTPVIEPKTYREDDDGGNGSGSNGGRSSGGSGSSGGFTYVGGGSSYKPKIYSNPRSVNNDRAATMYAKTPYTANRTYLRPAFYTKGSREAYRRQDM